MSVGAIVLAAGASRRLGEPKQLLQFHGETLLARAIRTAAEAGAMPVLAVLGAHAERICQSIELAPATQVINRVWEQGIASSIQAGLRTMEELAPLASGALLMTCDQPHLTVLHLQALIRYFIEHHGARIIASSYAGIVGTPAVFPASAYPGLYALNGDQGARSLLAECNLSIVSVPFERGEIDIDLPADRALLE